MNSVKSTVEFSKILSMKDLLTCSSSHSREILRRFASQNDTTRIFLLFLVFCR